MPDVIPFGGVYYNPDKVSKIESLVSPGFAFITEEVRSKLKEEVNNYAHLLLPDGNEAEKYKNAVNKFFGWLLRDVLIIDKKPSFYVVEAEKVSGGEQRRVAGLIGLLKLEDYGKSVKRGEMPLEKYTNERYSLLKESQSSLKPVGCLYKDQNGILEDKLIKFPDKQLIFEFDFFKTNYKLFKIDNVELFKEVKNFFKNTPVYIVDGHSDYEAALKYMKEMKSQKGQKYTGKEAFNYTLVCLFNFYNDGVQINPVHRGLRKLNIPITEFLKVLSIDYKFAALQFNNQREELIARRKLSLLISENRGKGVVSFGFYHKAALNRYFMLSYKSQTGNFVDIDVLNKTLLAKINVSPLDDSVVSYFYDYETACEYVKNGTHEATLFLNGTNKSKIIGLMDNNKESSPNSFCLFPQIPVGLILFSFRYSGFLAE
ncbi:MAG: DUF1015 family protein [Brevinematia bacterium]